MGWEIDITWLPLIGGALVALYICGASYIQHRQEIAEARKEEAKKSLENHQHKLDVKLAIERQDIDEELNRRRLQRQRIHEAEHINWDTKFHYAIGDSYGMGITNQEFGRDYEV